MTDDEALDFDLDLFDTPRAPKQKMSEEEVITRKLCPRCWKQAKEVRFGLEWCSYCDAALKYLKARPYAERNDP